jgi:hypothetical protein
MAALTRPGPLGVLDEAVRLLRGATGATLVSNAIGSVPFALSLLFAHQFGGVGAPGPRS